MLQADGTPVVYVGVGGSPLPNGELASASPIPTSESNEALEKPVAPMVPEKTEDQPSFIPAATAVNATPAVSASPAKPKPAAPTSSVDPKDAKIQSLTVRNQELSKQVEDLQKAVSKAASSNQVPPEWVALLNSQTGFPPVLVILIALFSFLVGLLF